MYACALLLVAAGRCMCLSERNTCVTSLSANIYTPAVWCGGTNLRGVLDCFHVFEHANNFLQSLPSIIVSTKVLLSESDKPTDHLSVQGMVAMGRDEHELGSLEWWTDVQM